MRSIGFVGCVKEKQLRRVPAKDLYVSTLFTLSRRYAEQACDQWYILSAQYGVLSPDELTAPYNMTLNAMNIGERRTWSERVLAAISILALRGDMLVFLAGKRYYEYLVGPLTVKGYQVELPLQGLSIGQRLHWLKLHTKDRTQP